MSYFSGFYFVGGFLCLFADTKQLQRDECVMLDGRPQTSSGVRTTTQCELGSLSTLTNVRGGGERESTCGETERERAHVERERAYVRGYVGEMMAVMTMETQPRERGRRPDIKTRTVEIGGAQQVPIRREHKDLHIGPGGQEAIV